jgi:hypothetical protein
MRESALFVKFDAIRPIRLQNNTNLKPPQITPGNKRTSNQYKHIK